MYIQGNKQELYFGYLQNNRSVHVQCLIGVKLIDWHSRLPKGTERNSKH